MAATKSVGTVVRKVSEIFRFLQYLVQGSTNRTGEKRVGVFLNNHCPLGGVLSLNLWDLMAIFVSKLPDK